MAHTTHRRMPWSSKDRHPDHAEQTTAGPPPPSPGAHAAPTTHESQIITREEAAHERFGGINWGAAFFGWLVAIAMTVLLSSILGAVATAIGDNINLTQDEAQREAGAIGLGAAIAVVLVMVIAYYAGGYVAGRMSRFDGGRQGLGTWLIGLVVTLVAVAVGWAFGSEYNILDRVDLPRIPIPEDAATLGGVLTGLALLVGSLLAAMTGGKVGHRYHNKVDRAAWH